jgi:lysophospholipase L1-like esterase
MSRRRARRLVRQTLLVAAMTLGLVLALETALRVAMSLGHGGSRYYLLYGLHGWTGRVDVSPWSTFTGEHYTFPPHYVLRGAAGQGEETASINALGFRGRDFEPRKPAGVFRVVCLGESSTFGFHNPDTGTYPFLLQQLLAEREAPGRVEVINAGFPYYNTASILSLLRAQVLRWKPDVVTLYAAFNDASWPVEIGPAVRGLLWLQQRSITYLVLKEHVATDRRIMAISRRLERRLPGRVDEAALERRIERIAARYRRNVEEIVDLVQAAGAVVVIARQPMRVGQRRDRTYEEQYQAVREKLRRGGRPSGPEQVLLAHHRLIDELDAISRARGLPVVDNIAIVDAHGDHLATYVHLTEQGNLRLAEGLRDAIQPVLAHAAAPRRPSSGSSAAVKTPVSHRP